MSRYRPPAPRSSPYITAAGHARLERELDALWVRRRDVVTHLSAAAAEGDRSENAEYQYRKKELAGIDRRIRYLQKRLPDLKVVAASAGGDTVRFGARVMLERGDDRTRSEAHIVGADEIDPAQQRVSIDSPLARALLGKTIDDEVSIDVEGRVLDYAVLAIEWPPLTEAVE